MMLVVELVAWYWQCYPTAVVEQHEARAKPLPPSTRPCLPDISSLINDWAPLSQDAVVKRVVEALKAWSFQVLVPTQLVCELAGLLGVYDCVAAVERADSFDACVLRCVYVAIVACDDVCLAKRLSHQLGLVTRAMVAWAFVPDLKTKKLTSLDFDHLLHMIGSIRMLLHTRWQALAGRRRKSWAIKRLQCVHPDLQVALFEPGPLLLVNQRACANFLAAQLRCKVGSLNEEGHLYLLCSLRQCYLGSTACSRRAWRCAMRSPMSRFYEHLHDLKLARRSASYAKFLRKTHIFKHVDLGDLCIWVVAVEQLAVVRSLEQCFLRVGHWPANSQSTKTPACKYIRRSQASRQPGRRPPPRFRLRPDRSQLEQRVSFIVIRAKNSVVKSSQICRSGLNDQQYLCQAFLMSFHGAYRHVQLHMLALTGQFGPLDLRHVRYEPLFACYLCDTKAMCSESWESIRQRWALTAACPGCEAIVSVFVLQRQPSCPTRARGLKACDRWLRRHNLPGTKKKKIRWPIAVPTSVFRSCLQDIRVSLVQSCGPLLARWIVSSVQAVPPPRKTYTCCWNHIQACRDLPDASLFNLPACSLNLSVSEGRQMQLCKKYWKTPIWEPVVGAAKRAITNLQSWLRMLGFSLGWRWHRHVRGWLGCCFANISHDLTDHWTYVERLRVPPGFVAVQEDKDKASCWLLPCSVYNKLFALMVKQDAHHWVRHTGNVVEVVEHYRQLHEDKLPSHLRGFCAHSRWKQWRLPYMYINIKSKCFESSIGRVCLKPSHACCRRIVSWATHPCKWLYKFNARALEGAVRLWGKGFETHDLFSAVRDLRVAVGKLNHSHDFVHSCYKCKSSKQPLCVWVGDAAQLFEEVCRDEVLTRLKAILAELREASNGSYGIVTKKSRRLHYWLARNNFRPSAGARLHRWDEMIAITEVALAQTCVRVGPVLFQQCRGVPIGGFLSKQCASVYLGFSEAQWVQNAKEEHTLWFPPQLTFYEAVAATRYVDDLVLVSSVLCGACLNTLPGSIYQQPVSFDAAKPAQLGVPWLDVWLRCDGLNLDVLAHGVEGPWRAAAAAGDVGPPAKFRLMPFQGVAMLDEQMLLALLNGKLNRWCSLDLSHVNLLRAVECELQIWALHGYPLGVMLKIWRRGRHYPAAVRHARIILQKAVAKHGEQACVPLSLSK